MEDGEVLYVVADAATGVQDTYVTRHMLAEIRPTGASSGTIKKRLEGIRIGLSWLRRRDIDIESRIATGQYLTNEELSLIAAECLRRADDTGNVVGSLATNRFSSFIRYLEFRTEEVLHFANRSHHRSIIAAKGDFRDRAGKLAPSAKAGAAPNERLGLEPELRNLFLRVIKPDDPGNPFQAKLRIRNHALLLLPFTFGLRSGEEFGLKGRDYVVKPDGTAEITIHRRPDDPDDTRQEPALTKTLARTLPVEGELRQAMDAWRAKRQDRGLFPKARKHPYLFVATDGGPLTLRSARAIYDRLRAVHPELAGVAQHVLRHDRNDRWTEEDEEIGGDPHPRGAPRLYTMGWSPLSKQPENYSKAAIRRSVQKRLTRIQRQALGDEGAS
jgi:hypothetical protein